MSEINNERPSDGSPTSGGHRGNGGEAMKLRKTPPTEGVGYGLHSSTNVIAHLRGANETVNEMNKEASDPLGGASCSASLFWRNHFTSNNPSGHRSFLIEGVLCVIAVGLICWFVVGHLIPLIFS